jgi:hypothetical protein
MRAWIKPVATGATLGLLGFAGTLLWNHWVQANDDHVQQLTLEELSRSNYAVVEQLVKIHEDEDAAMAERKKLCVAGKIVDRETCAEAGVELE